MFRLRLTSIALFLSVLQLSVLFALEKEPDVNKTNVATVPPPGVEPYDPKPLMTKLNERIRTDKFRFIVLGDAKHAKTLPALLKYLDEINPDFVLTTGDMVSGGGGKVGPGYYEMLSEEAGENMRKRPWWPAIGNHEIAGQPITGKEALTENSDTQKKNQQTGVENFKRFYNLDKEYYSFSFRNCYFIALPFRYPKDKQIEWLEEELKKASAAKQHIIIFNHAPFFTIGKKPASEIPSKETPITALFKKYGVNAVFSGHDHGYYRTVRSGIPYFTTAGGGAKIYPALRLKEALPEDVYYYGDAKTFEKNMKEKDQRFVLHKNDGTPDKVSEVADQFMCVVEVDGNKINCYTVTSKGDRWDDIVLSK